MLQYLSQRGVDADAVAHACGIQLRVPAGPDDRVPGRQVEWLWSMAATVTDDPLVGLHMAEAYSPGALDILGYVVLSCRTVGDVLDRLSRYAHILNDGMRIDVLREGSVAWCRCRSEPGMDNYLDRSPAQAVDTMWAGLARELRRLAARPLAATEVWFRHPAPPEAVPEYHRVLGAHVRFGAPEDRFILPLAHLDEHVRSANPSLLDAFEAHADDMLSRMEARGPRSQQVAREVARRLTGSAAPPLSEVARALAMSERNLQRALRDDGTSFQKLLDEVRRDLAISHLADPTTSAGQVGFLLGFSEPSAFHRAFRRWTGKTPSAYRLS